MGSFGAQSKEKNTNLHEVADFLDQFWIARCPCLFAKGVLKTTVFESKDLEAFLTHKASGLVKGISVCVVFAIHLADQESN